MSRNYQIIIRRLRETIQDNGPDTKTREDAAEMYLRSLHIYGVKDKVDFRNNIREIITPRDWEVFPVVRIAFLKVFFIDIAEHVDTDILNRDDEYVANPEITDRPNGPQRPGAGENGQSIHHNSLVRQETSKRPWGPENTYDNDKKKTPIVRNHKHVTPQSRETRDLLEDLGYKPLPMWKDDDD